MDVFQFDPMTVRLEREDVSKRRMVFGDKLRGRFGHLFGEKMTSNNADRSEFILNKQQLHHRIENHPFEIVESVEDAQMTIWLPPAVGRRYSLPENIPIEAEAVTMLADSDPKAGKVLASGINEAKRALKRNAREEAWWLGYADQRHYTRNPFEKDPTEQFVIDDGGLDLNIYNFSSPLTKWQLVKIAQTFNLMSQLTNGHSSEIVPNLVIHDAFANNYFTRTNSFEQPAGQAWQGKPFIEIHPSVFSYGRFEARGSLGQTWLEQVLVHEIMHQLDYEADSDKSLFEDYFQYIDFNGDMIIDKIKPRDALIFANSTKPKHRNNLNSVYGAKAVRISAPHRDYGFTGPVEDLPVASEEAAFGGEVDSLRRDAFIHVLQRLVIASDNRLAEKLGSDHPDYERLVSDMAEDHPITVPVDGLTSIRIEKRVGSNMRLPEINSLKQPFNLLVAVRTNLGRRLLDMMLK